MKTLFEGLEGTYTPHGNYLLPDIKLTNHPEYDSDILSRFCKSYFHYYSVFSITL